MSSDSSTASTMVKASLPEKSSFLHMCTCLMPRTFFRHTKFYFLLKWPIAFPVWHQLCCDCQGEESSTIFQVLYNAPPSSSFCRSSSFWGLSSVFRLSSFLTSTVTVTTPHLEENQAIWTGHLDKKNRNS